jgi:class 3 adenylate cyclase
MAFGGAAVQKKPFDGLPVPGDNQGMRHLGLMSLAGLGIAAIVAVAFAEWMYATNPADALVSRLDILRLSSGLLGGSAHGDALYTGIRALLAGLGLVASGLAAWILLRASQALPARLVAWLLLGISSFTFVMHFMTVDARYPPIDLSPLAVNMAMLVAITWLAALAARFLVVFPRPVDGDSVMATFWARRRKREYADASNDAWARWRKRLHDPDARSRILLPWHAALVDGSMVWIAPAVAAGLVVIGHALAWMFPWTGWGGIWTTLIVVALGWYLVHGLPFAYASTTHLYANGTPEDRARVSWVRAVGLLAAAATLMLVVITLLQIAIFRGDDTFLPVAGLVMLAIQLAPIVFVSALAIAVLYRGALDPRLAVTRVTVWSFVGLAMTALFLLVERYVAVKLVGWLSLPADSGLVIAGAVIAATFTPVRRATERGVSRIAERYMPLAALAGGARVTKTVLICDLSGYTALSAQDEPRALLLGALLKRQGERVASANGGHLVKSMGDAVMITFPTNAAAARAANALHANFPGAADVAGVAPLPLHTALHRGEIVESHDGDIYGQTVNVCARLVDAASKGEIVLSATAIEELGDTLAVEPIGERRFKNVPEAIVCFRAVWGKGIENADERR